MTVALPFGGLRPNRSSSLSVAFRPRVAGSDAGQLAENAAHFHEIGGTIRQARWLNDGPGLRRLVILLLLFDDDRLGPAVIVRLRCFVARERRQFGIEIIEPTASHDAEQRLGHSQVGADAVHDAADVQQVFVSFAEDELRGRVFHLRLRRRGYFFFFLAAGFFLAAFALVAFFFAMILLLR